MTATVAEGTPNTLTIQTTNGGVLWVGCQQSVAFPSGGDNYGNGTYIVTGEGDLPTSINVGLCVVCATCANCSVYPPTMGTETLADTYEVSFILNPCFTTTTTVTVTNSMGSPCTWVGTVVQGDVTATVTLALGNPDDDSNQCQFTVDVSLETGGGNPCFDDVQSDGTPTAGDCPDPTEFSYPNATKDNGEVVLSLENVSVAA